MERKPMEHFLDLIKHYNPDTMDVVNNDKDVLGYFVYVINLKTCIYRRNYMIYMMKKLRMNFKLVVVEPINADAAEKFNNQQNVHLKRGEIGCCLSHLWCFQHAIQNNHERVIILEDDCLFDRRFREKLESIDMTIFDMLMLGSIDFSIKENIKTLENGVYRLRLNTCGSHANIYSLSMIKTLFERKIRHVTSFDVGFEELYTKYNIGVCWPNLVICELSTTNIDHNFSPLMRPTAYHEVVRKCFLGRIHYENYHMFLVLFLKFIHKKRCQNGCIEINDVRRLVYDFNVFYSVRRFNLLKHMTFNIDELREMVALVESDTYLEE